MLPLRSLALLLALVLYGCSGIRVQTDHDAEADFEAFTSYAWLPPEDRGATDPLLDGRIQRAIDDELAAKGLRLVSPDKASLLATFRVSVGETFQVNDPYYSIFPYDVYPKGTLVVDLMDPRANALIWRGVGETRVRELKTPEEREQRIRDVVAAILAKYPPD
jgi:hypothetical protein